MTPTRRPPPPTSGDHPRSKLYQAKNVLRQIVKNNQDKVSFLIGRTTRTASAEEPARARRQPLPGTDDNPKPPTKLTVQGTDHNTRRTSGASSPGSSSSERGEALLPEGPRPRTRSATPALRPAPVLSQGGPSTTAGTLATDLRTAINVASCTPRPGEHLQRHLHRDERDLHLLRTRQQLLPPPLGGTPLHPGRLRPRGDGHPRPHHDSLLTAAPFTLLYRITGTVRPAPAMHTTHVHGDLPGNQHRSTNCGPGACSTARWSGSRAMAGLQDDYPDRGRPLIEPAEPEGAAGRRGLRRRRRPGGVRLGGGASPGARRRLPGLPPEVLPRPLRPATAPAPGAVRSSRARGWSPSSRSARPAACTTTQRPAPPSGAPTTAFPTDARLRRVPGREVVDTVVAVAPSGKGAG